MVYKNRLRFMRIYKNVLIRREKAKKIRIKRSISRGKG